MRFAIVARRSAACACIYFALSPLPASAQAKLDIYSAMTEVDANHPLANAKREDFRAAESGLSAAKQQRLPSFSVQSSRPNTVNSSTLNVARVQQPLYAGGRIDAGIDRGEALVAEAKASLDATRRDLMLRTSNSYIEVIKGTARLAIAEKNVAEHIRLLDSIGRRVDAEISPESDLLLTQSRLAQAQTERSQVALNLRRAQDALSELMSRPVTESLSLPRLTVRQLELEPTIAAALVFSPEIRRAEAQEVIASADFDLARSAALPSVFVRHEQLIGSLDPGYSRSQTYLGVEFVSGAGLSTASQIKAADNRKRSASETKRASEKDTRDKVRALWVESQSLKAQVRSTEGYVSAARAVAESFSRQFTIGRRSWLEVLNSIREWLLAELAHTDLTWNSTLVDFRLEIEAGRLTADLLTSLKNEPELLIPPDARGTSR